MGQHIVKQLFILLDLKITPFYLAVCEKSRTFALAKREHSSVGSEHLPYKQRVIGSTPIVPTKKGLHFWSPFFFLLVSIVMFLAYKAVICSELKG